MMSMTVEEILSLVYEVEDKLEKILFMIGEYGIEEERLGKEEIKGLVEKIKLMKNEAESIVDEYSDKS